MGKPQFRVSFYRIYPFTLQEAVSMKGIDASPIYKTIKINTLEQNTQVRHNRNTVWIHLNPSKINTYLPGACCALRGL